MRSTLRLPVCAFALILLAFNPRLAGQTVPAATNQDVVVSGNKYSLTASEKNLDLRFGCLVQGSDGNFYGASELPGTVFKVTPAGVRTVLHRFQGTDGGLPNDALVQGSDGNFYGTTRNGGAGYEGTVFKITPAGVFTTLHSFTGNGFLGSGFTGKRADGAQPAGGLALGSDGNFYGATWTGGRQGKGTVFRITPAGAVTILHSFVGEGHASWDFELGKRYAGTSADGECPGAGLVRAADGNFYGMTEWGGRWGLGMVYRITPAGKLTRLHSFNGRGTEGAEPGNSNLIQGRDGNFYGTTTAGGSNGTTGTVFQMTPAGVVRTLYSFPLGFKGCSPANGCVQGSDGNFYGTTITGGANNKGAIFQVAAPGRKG